MRLRVRAYEEPFRLQNAGFINHALRGEDGSVASVLNGGASLFLVQAQDTSALRVHVVCA